MLLTSVNNTTDYSLNPIGKTQILLNYCNTYRLILSEKLIYFIAIGTLHGLNTQ